MFIPARWARAFINSLEERGGEAGEGINALKVFSAWASSLPGAVFGSSAARSLERLARESILKTGGGNPALETALRFTALMVRKNSIHHLDQVIGEAEKILDKKNGVLPVFVESALPLESDFERRLKEAVGQKTGAARVDITGRINPELIGGYRLRVGDEIVDASVRFQLEKLEGSLAGGIFGSTGGLSSSPAGGGN